MDNPINHTSTFLTLATIVVGTITHFTANGVAAFFTITAGATATIYNIVKTKEIRDKKKDIKWSKNTKK